MPLVSVVVPSHNRARLLRRTLRSILAQHLTDLEVVLVDDGSTDETPQITNGADPRIVVIRNQEPGGVSAARNRGIAAARGEWIAFCDDDDLWSPDKLSRQLMAAERTGAGWVYSGDVNIDDKLHVLSGGPPNDPQDVMALLPRWNPIPPVARTSWCARKFWRPSAASIRRSGAPRIGTCGFASRARVHRPAFGNRWSPIGFTRETR